ncbi:PQQ-binding-like beta-propeller repeat protein [candidate division KSB1 bacterium]|nr:PQQ-binding-like beta-propeller repeat protein [candidate division KSB1 bacterium]
MKTKSNYKRLSLLAIIMGTSILLFFGCSRIIINPEMQEHQLLPNWKLAGGNPQRTFNYPLAVKPPLEIHFIKRLPAAIDRNIIVVDSVLYFGTQHEHVYAYNIVTSKKIGKKNMEYASTCAYVDHQLLVAERYGDKTLHSLNLYNNDWMWQIDAGDIESEPLICPKGIVISALYNHVDLYTIESGTKLWTFNTNDQIRSSPAYGDGKIFFGCDDGAVYALDESNGKEIWHFQTEGAVEATPAVDLNARLVLIGSSDFRFYAINMDTGNEVWSFRANGQLLNNAAVSFNNVIFGSTDNKLYCLNIKNGALRWQYTCESVISTSPLISGDIVFLGSLDQNLYAVDLSSGKKIWQYKTHGRIRTNPVAWGEYLAVASEDNYLYVFKSVEKKEQGD